MNDTQFNKALSDLKNISLSQNEKQKMLAEITAYTDFHAPKTASKKSATILSWSFFQAHGALAVRTLSFVLIVCGTSYLANNSLPGDILYPVKIHINEAVYGSLLKTPEEKAQWNSDTFIRRVEEAETLARSGKLSESSLAQIEHNIDTSFAKIQGENPVADVAVARTVAPQASTMTLQANMKMAAFMATPEKDELEQKIEEHREILETLVHENGNEQNALIRRLLMKLDEKATIRAQSK